MTIFTDGLRQSRGVDINDLSSGVGGYLGAKADESFHSDPSVSSYDISELNDAERRGTSLGVDRVMRGEDPADVLYGEQPAVPETPTAVARQRVKDAGLEQTLHLPDAPSIKTPALDIMIDRARARREREATIARGPDSYFVGALGVGTSFLVGALDPLNVASAFIPVIGEARYANLMAAAGTSAIARTGARTGVGAVSGVVGQAVVEPLEARARTQEGQDYTMADALRSLMFGAVLGGGLHAGGGAIADVYRSRSGTPLFPFAPGEPHFDREAGLFKVTPGDRAPARAGEAPAAPERIDDTFLNPPVSAAPEERHLSLVEFLASRGGLRNDDAMIADVQSVLGRDNHLVPGEGNLIRKPGQVSSAGGRGGAHEPMTLDQAREAAVEAGYLVDHGKEAGGVGTTTVRSLLDAMDGELRGQKVYPAGARPKVTAAELEHLSEERKFRQEQAHTDLDRALQEAGFKPGDVPAETRARAVDLMLKEGVHEPLDAYERASAEGPTPVVAALDDLPPRAKEDALRASIAALHDGGPVRAAELLQVAAKTDPRIAESLKGLEEGPGATDWHGLAEARREFDDPDSQAASQAAQNAPAPASVSPEPNKRIQAAEAAEARAEAEYRDAEPYLPEDLKARVERDLAQLDADLADRTEVIRRGAACLAAVAGGAA